MTVGIILNNTHTSVAVADSRVLLDNIRFGDVANKLVTIKSPHYDGAMVGAGAAQVIFQVFRHVKTLDIPNLEAFLKSVREYWFNLQEDIKMQVLDAYYAKVNNIAKHLKRDNSETLDTQDIMYKMGQIEDSMLADCLFAAYDRKANRIKKYRMYPETCKLESNFESIIGSGADAAELELLKLIPGASLGSIEAKEMVFFAMCGYIRATQNVGVGGLPKIAIITKEGVKKVSKHHSITLANIVAAYEAGVVPRAYAEEQVANILMGRADYNAIGETLKMTPYSVQNLLVPLDSWIVSANLQRYPKKDIVPENKKPSK